MIERPATAGQRLLWLMSRYRGGAASMSAPALCRLSGPLDEVALRGALDELTRRHESLRTTFSGAGRRLTQHVHEPRPMPLRHASGTVAEELAEPLDPATWPVRASLVAAGPDAHVLCLNVHHFVTDGWSTGILLREWAALYDAIVSGADADLPAPGRVPDTDPEGTPQWRTHADYWKSTLDGVRLGELPVHIERVDHDERTTSGSVPLRLAPDLIDALTAVGIRERVTLFPVLLAVFYAMLARRTGQRDVAVATLFANRTRASELTAVGFFATMVLLRMALPADATFADALRASRASVLGALAHQAMPVQMAPVSLPAGSARVEDLLFQVLPRPLLTRRAGDLLVRQFLAENLASRFDLELILIPDGAGGFDGQVAYATDRFDPAWVADLADEYVTLATRFAADPATPLS